MEDKVKKIIAKQLGVNDDQVVPGASFINDLGADSTPLSWLWPLRRSLISRSLMRMRRR